MKNGFTLVTGLFLLMTVMLIGLISISSLQWNTGNIQTYFLQGQELSVVGDSCLEEAALRLKNDASFRSTTLNISSNSCIIALNEPLGEVYTGTITSTSQTGQNMAQTVSLRRIVRPQSVQIQITKYKTL